MRVLETRPPYTQWSDHCNVSQLSGSSKTVSEARLFWGVVSAFLARRLLRGYKEVQAQMCNCIRYKSSWTFFFAFGFLYQAQSVAQGLSVHYRTGRISSPLVLLTHFLSVLGRFSVWVHLWRLFVSLFCFSAFGFDCF